tara:strand:- start:17385 stop:17915 length:531 start_codon:yes stop_codon:yes gene_type:complete
MAELFEADFDIKDKLLPYKQALIDDYYNNKDNRGYSKKVNIPEVVDIIKPQWLEIIQYHFHPLPQPRGEFKVWGYVQNNTNNRSVWHNHPEAELNTVFYLETPKEGGELEILNVRPLENKFSKELIKVKENKLYIMPFWTYHRPKLQKDTNERICFNVQYFTKDRKRLLQRNGINW